MHSKEERLKRLHKGSFDEWLWNECARISNSSDPAAFKWSQSYKKWKGGVRCMLLFSGSLHHHIWGHLEFMSGYCWSLKTNKTKVFTREKNHLGFFFIKLRAIKKKCHDFMEELKGWWQRRQRFSEAGELQRKLTLQQTLRRHSAALGFSWRWFPSRRSELHMISHLSSRETSGAARLKRLNITPSGMKL